MNFSFQESNQQLIWVLLVGLALGIANYSLGVWPSIGQSLVQQLSISLWIGYGLLLFSFNAKNIIPSSISRLVQYGLMSGIFAIIGLTGTELQSLVNSFVFEVIPYQPFSAGGVYLFNGILSIILGVMTLSWVGSRQRKKMPLLDQEKELPSEPLESIPVKTGEAVQIISLKEILYFEAFDNYSFLFDQNGKKLLTSYSLALLEKRLPDPFIRVHRKYLVNKDQIQLIKPHLKGRYVLEFKGKADLSVTTSSSYTDKIRALLKL